MVGHGVPVHTSLQELDQVVPGGNPKALAQDAALPPTLQARAEEVCSQGNMIKFC